MREIQEQVRASGRLSQAFIPMLQRISPGDLQNARNAMDFARVTVTEWLCKYKFKDWTEHRTHSPGTPVTDEEREKRAAQIADELSKHSKWKTHGRSLRLSDLKALRLEIVDYSAKPELNDPIQRYYVMLRLFLDNADVYKVFETVEAQVIQRFTAGPPSNGQAAMPADKSAATSVTAAVRCNSCGNVMNVQANLAPGQPLAAGAVAFPVSEQITCRCGNVVDLKPLKDHVEREFGRPIVPS
jgi:hypothetical protein